LAFKEFRKHSLIRSKRTLNKIRLWYVRTFQKIRVSYAYVSFNSQCYYVTYWLSPRPVVIAHNLTMQWYCNALKAYFHWIIIRSDRRPETKQEIEGKIDRFRSGRVKVKVGDRVRVSYNWSPIWT